MKILMINSVCGIRSTGRICTELADKYIADGHIVKIAYGREEVPDKYKEISVRISNNMEVYLSVLKARLLDNEGFNNISATKRFLKWADEYNPDLLWLHNLHGYYINLDLLFKWIKARPNMQVKWTLHDCWAFTGHCSHFTFEKCEKWKSGCHNCSQTKAYPTSYIKDNSIENFERKKEVFIGIKQMILITPSNWLADLVKQSFLKSYPIEVHHNTIDRTVFKPTSSNFREKYGLKDKKIVLGVASAWGKKKGLDDFIKLSKILDKEYVIVLVGLSKKQLKNLPKNMIGITCTNSTKALAEIYTASDVFINLTYEDTYPTVNLEAQACDTPCITYRTGGSVESVEFQNIVEVGDLEAVKTRIISIISSNYKRYE